MAVAELRHIPSANGEVQEDNHARQEQRVAMVTHVVHADAGEFEDDFQDPAHWERQEI